MRERQSPCLLVEKVTYKTRDTSEVESRKWRRRAQLYLMTATKIPIQNHFRFNSPKNPGPDSPWQGSDLLHRFTRGPDPNSTLCVGSGPESYRAGEKLGEP